MNIIKGAKVKLYNFRVSCILWKYTDLIPHPLASYNVLPVNIGAMAIIMTKGYNLAI